MKDSSFNNFMPVHGTLYLLIGNKYIFFTLLDFRFQYNLQQYIILIAVFFYYLNYHSCILIYFINTL